MVDSLDLNFRVFTVKLKGVQILRYLTHCLLGNFS